MTKKNPLFGKEIYHKCRKGSHNTGRDLTFWASKNVDAAYAARLVKKGLARRLLRGKLSLVDDDFAIASQLINPVLD